MTRLKLIFGLGLILAALLTAGCGADKPVEDQDQPGQQYYGPSHHSTMAPATLAPAPVAMTGNDSLAIADQLASGAGRVSAPDPGDVSPLNSGDQLADGPKPATGHSHWLRGGVFNADVTVSLNGRFLGEFRAPVDKDITMSTREGFNTVTVTYTPREDTSSAHLDILESEHTPPISPLASFHSPLFTLGKPQQPVKRTFTFIAR